MKELKYTYVDFIAIKKLNISINEYILCDIIYKLQAKQGFCWASNYYFSNYLNMTERGIIKMIQRLIEKGVIVVIEKKKGETNKLCVDDIWHETVIFSSEQSSVSSELSSHEPLNKVHTTTELSSYNNNIYNNSDNNKDISNITSSVKTKSQAPKSRIKKEVITVNSSSDITSMLMYFYHTLLPGVGVVHSPTNRKAIDGMITAHGIKDLRETIDKAKSLLGVQYAPQISNISVFATKYLTIKNYKSNKIQYQPVQHF
jgi:hypothetical protein